MSIQKPEIVDFLMQNGLELRRKGSRFWAICPFHSEKTPSFSVSPERQYAYCFGCNWHGDIIAFVKDYHGLQFKDALSYLGIDKGSYKPDPLKVRDFKRRKELIACFRSWEKGLRDQSAQFLLLYRRFEVSKDLSEEDLIMLAEMRKHYDYCEYVYEDILCKNDESAKFELFKEELGLAE